METSHFLRCKKDYLHTFHVGIIMAAADLGHMEPGYRFNIQ